MNFPNRRATAILLILLFSLIPLNLLGETEEPTRGGKLTVALPTEPPGLDPTTNTAAVIDRVLYNNVYQGLVRINRKGEIVPSLARDWELLEGGRLYRFHLREDVLFHNGEKFSSADVVFTLNRARGEETTVPNPEYFDPIEEVKATDRLTVEIRLSRPSSSFLFDLARGDSVILPEGISKPSTVPVGTGPFEFDEWKRGDSVTLKRFEDYYEESLPYLEEVVFEFIGDPGTRISGLRSGGIDAIAYLSSPEHALSIKEDQSLKVLEGVTTWEVVMSMNNSREPFSDPLVRKAINYAIDQEEIIEGATFGFGKPIGSLMSPSNPNYVDLSWLYPHDPEKAKELLERAGYPEGFQATLTLPSTYDYSLRAGKIIADQLKRTGIELEIEKISWAQWLERVFSSARYDLTVIGHAEAFDISIYADTSYYFRYDSERFREVIRRAEGETDEETRRGLYGIAQWIIAEDAASAFLFSAPSLPAMKNEVRNWWEDYPLPVVDVTRVWKEK
ncbi:MAG: ABC transporter substrate-binding protein [Candidatus Bipolaricaulota bacterium]